MYLYTARLIIVQRELCRHLILLKPKQKDKVLKTDKQRRTYYDYYTSKNWGVMSNYDLCIDAEKIRH